MQFQSEIKSTLTQTLNELEGELLGIESRLRILSETIKPQIDNLIREYGLECVQFSIAAMDIDDDELRRRYDTIGMDVIERVKSAQAERIAKPLEAEGEKAAIDALGDDWDRLQAANILGDLANNPGAGGVASAGAGIGMGFAAGNAFSNMSQQMFSKMGNDNNGKQNQTQNPGKGRFIQKNESENMESSNTKDPVEVLKQLKELLDMGVITSEEYENKKNK